jgi:hypothetical protein
MPSKEDRNRSRQRPRLPTGKGQAITLPKLGGGQQFRCPTCLVDVTPDMVRTVDFDGRAGTASLPVRGRIFTRSAAEPATVTQIMSEGRFTCSRGHTLPKHLFSIGLMPVALLGLSQSMKTHYVAAAAYQLTNDYALGNLPGKRSLSFQVLDECYERLDREYVSPLFDRHEELVPTEAVIDPKRDEPVRDPITFEVKFTVARSFSNSGTKSTYVSLYDAPGEMFRTRRDQVVHAPYLLDPAGVLLFLDAGSIADVRRSLTTGAPENFTRFDPHIIHAAARSMRDLRGRDGQVDVPVSVIISRADLLQHSSTFARFHAFLGDEPLLDSEADAAARAFVTDHAPGIAMATADAFGKHRVRYFFASATGCSPVDGRFPDVRPWGCLGPLLWIMTADGWVTE